MAIVSPALHHVTFRTRKLDEMLAWYARVVGARVLFRNEVAAWTTNDEANHRLAFLAVPGLSEDPDRIRHTGLHHCAFEYRSFEDLMTSYARLRDEEVTPAFCLDHGMTVSIYYRDPEANFVELQSDCFENWKLSTEFIRAAPQFAANPIGVFFDAEKVFAAYKSGVGFAELHEGIRAEKYLPAVIPNIGLPDAG